MFGLFKTTSAATPPTLDSNTFTHTNASCGDISLDISAISNNTVSGYVGNVSTVISGNPTNVTDEPKLKSNFQLEKSRNAALIALGTKGKRSAAPAHSINPTDSLQSPFPVPPAFKSFSATPSTSESLSKAVPSPFLSNSSFGGGGSPSFPASGSAKSIVSSSFTTSAPLNRNKRDREDETPDSTSHVTTAENKNSSSSTQPAPAASSVFSAFSKSKLPATDTHMSSSQTKTAFSSSTTATSIWGSTTSAPITKSNIPLPAALDSPTEVTNDGNEMPTADVFQPSRKPTASSSIFLSPTKGPTAKTPFSFNFPKTAGAPASVQANSIMTESKKTKPSSPGVLESNSVKFGNKSNDRVQKPFGSDAFAGLAPSGTTKSTFNFTPVVKESKGSFPVLQTQPYTSASKGLMKPARAVASSTEPIFSFVQSTNEKNTIFTPKPNASTSINASTVAFNKQSTVTGAKPTFPGLQTSFPVSASNFKSNVTSFVGFAKGGVATTSFGEKSTTSKPAENLPSKRPLFGSNAAKLSSNQPKSIGVLRTPQPIGQKEGVITVQATKPLSIGVKSERVMGSLTIGEAKPKAGVSTSAHAPGVPIPVPTHINVNTLGELFHNFLWGVAEATENGKPPSVKAELFMGLIDLLECLCSSPQCALAANSPEIASVIDLSNNSNENRELSHEECRQQDILIEENKVKNVIMLEALMEYHVNRPTSKESYNDWKKCWVDFFINCAEMNLLDSLVMSGRRPDWRDLILRAYDSLVYTFSQCSNCPGWGGVHTTRSGSVFEFVAAPVLLRKIRSLYDRGCAAQIGLKSSVSGVGKQMGHILSNLIRLKEELPPREPKDPMLYLQAVSVASSFLTLHHLRSHIDPNNIRKAFRLFKDLSEGQTYTPLEIDTFLYSTRNSFKDGAFQKSGKMGISTLQHLKHYASLYGLDSSFHPCPIQSHYNNTSKSNNLHTPSSSDTIYDEQEQRHEAILNLQKLAAIQVTAANLALGMLPSGEFKRIYFGEKPLFREYESQVCYYQAPNEHKDVCPEPYTGAEVCASFSRTYICGNIENDTSETTSMSRKWWFICTPDDDPSAFFRPAVRQPFVDLFIALQTCSMDCYRLAMDRHLPFYIEYGIERAAFEVESLISAAKLAKELYVRSNILFPVADHDAASSVLEVPIRGVLESVLAKEEPAICGMVEVLNEVELGDTMRPASNNQLPHSGEELDSLKESLAQGIRVDKCGAEAEEGMNDDNDYYGDECEGDWSLFLTEMAPCLKPSREQPTSTSLLHWSTYIQKEAPHMALVDKCCGAANGEDDMKEDSTLVIQFSRDT